MDRVAVGRAGVRVSAVAGLLIAGLLAAACTTPSAADSRVPGGSLWQRTVDRYLTQPLWENNDAYDATHYLMVPMHAAFELGNTDQEHEFIAFFQRFAEQGSLPTERLARLQFSYLLSQFVVLADETYQPGAVPASLLSTLYDEVRDVWIIEPGTIWSASPFPLGMQQRVAWILSKPQVSPSYYAAVTDYELFEFAIAADLAQHENLTAGRGSSSSLLPGILRSAHAVFRAEVVPTRGEGWLFQPGVWRDLPDYLYAGDTKKEANPPIATVSDIAWDSSHSMRFPLWLTSLEGAYAPGSGPGLYYHALLFELGHQFLNVVLGRPTATFPAYRLSNYMDGLNGLYRWRHSTQGPNDGYGPYEESGTLVLGWWGFLRTPAVCNMYAALSRDFPLPQNVVDVYVGPNTTRVRNPLVRLPDSLSNGFSELIVDQAAAVCRDAR